MKSNRFYYKKMKFTHKDVEEARQAMDNGYKYRRYVYNDIIISVPLKYIIKHGEKVEVEE